jgi:hypothetical protein
VRNINSRSSVVLVLAVACIACASKPFDVANRYYSPERFPAKAASEVELLFEKPARNFDVIADFQARNETADGMRSRAAEVGADAVIVVFLGGGQDKEAEWAGQGQYRTNDRVVGTAIKYK